MPSKVGKYHEPVRLNHRDGASKRGTQNGERAGQGRTDPDNIAKDAGGPSGKLPKASR
jgi:hypothetical protein